MDEKHLLAVWGSHPAVAYENFITLAGIPSGGQKETFGVMQRAVLRNSVLQRRFFNE